MPSNEQEEEVVQRKPFAAFLTEHRKGSLHSELSEALAEVAAAVIEHGKAGTISLSLKLTANKDGQSVEITDALKKSVPQASRGASMFFVDHVGNVSRNNPMQDELPLRAVPGAAPTQEAEAI